MKIRGKVQQYMYVKIGGKITDVWAAIGGEWRQTGACARAQRGTTQQALHCTIFTMCAGYRNI